MRMAIFNRSGMIKLNVNISMTVGQIFTKIGTFIENRHIHAAKLKLRKAC